MRFWLRWLLAASFLSTLAACSLDSNDDDHPAPPPANVVVVAQSDPKFSVLVEAVTAAGLGTTLTGAGPFTVFAPTNDAFNALLTELGITKAALLADKALLTSVLTYHVLPAKVLKADVPAGKPITTVQGATFQVDAVNGALVITDGRNRKSTITATDLVAANGVVHVVDKVILPPTTVVGVAQGNPDFSILVEAVTAAGLSTTLSGNGPFTVFAPTNAAFAALLTELGVTKAQLLADKTLLTSVLTYHVLPAKVLKAAVPTATPITTVQGATFRVDAVGANLVITDGRNRKSTITATDLNATNGVVHVVDKVILPPLPPTTVVGVAQGNPDFSILVEAVVAAGLDTTLSGAGPFTVFAPTNAAFAALLTELGVTKAQLLADKPLLNTVLTYHVLPAKVLRAGVPAGKAITTVQGSIFKVDAVGSGLVITDGRNRKSNITTTDLAATNGTVHVIDKVILPANKNIVETAVSLPQFSILVEAVTAANLGGALSATGPLTVFAPTNDAFAAALTELGLTKAQLLANTALLTKVLTYHVVSGRVLKADVPVGTAIPTLQTETFTVDNTLAITDQRGRKSNITGTDVLTSNGVIHVIDKVILPKP
jgi:uncharacterized surface protein with fasciclin (FAS1) repeats